MADEKTVQWSKEQQQAFTLRDRNLLVSAAAGSGKTTVLVERILRRIMDEKHPTDIDRLLITTFTKASADDMKEKIHRSLLARAEKDPSNLHIRRQLLRLPSAHIGTLDSFCRFIVNNYYHTIDLDPTFRLPDTAEEELLKSDVYDALVEERYAANQETFLKMMESLTAADKNDEKAKEAILTIFDKSQSAPYPEQWLRDCAGAYAVTDEEEIMQTDWFIRWRESLLANCRQSLDLLTEASDLLETIPENPKVLKWQTCLAADRDVVQRFQADILASPRYSEYESIRDAVKFQTAPHQITEDPNGAKIKSLRDQCKSTIQGFSFPPLANTEELRDIVNELVAFLLDFTRRFREEKQKRHYASFSDIAHYALQILLKDGQPTDVGRELASHFDEILVDEYQDINEIQETILYAVSGEPNGRNNVFRVGDIKQSIYQFRMAKPDLFREKYETYTTYDGTDGPCQKIELRDNYRSRPCVTETVNYFCRKIMHKSIGGVEYSEDVELKPQGKFIDVEEATHISELVLIDESADGTAGTEDTAYRGDAETEEESLSEERKDMAAGELEAEYIAGEIRALLDSRFLVQAKIKTVDEEGHEKETVGLRPIEPKDIVILSRALTVPEVFLNALDRYGIRSFAERKTGFYKTFEVSTVLNFLKAVDNPLDDVALVATLTSYIFKIQDEELARIRAPFRDSRIRFYEALVEYSKLSDNDLAKRCVGVMDTLERYREYAEEAPLSMVLRRLYNDFGLYAYAAAMPSGRQRAANLDELVNKASDFEETSYHGITNFIRYIAIKEKTEVDEGESSITDEQDNVVRVMTIHKSKGLEFPVVFLCGLGRKRSQQDLRKNILVHPDLHIGLQSFDRELRTKNQTLYRQIVAQKIKEDQVGEELRLLYVAMTRAKEKLYLVSTYKPTKSGELFGNGTISESEILSASTNRDLLCKCYDESAPLRVTRLSREQLLAKEAEEVGSDHVRLITTLAYLQNLKAIREIKEIFTYDYNYDDKRAVSESVSVSALKKAGMENISTPDDVVTSPYTTISFDPAETKISGAAIGTAYHTVMEHWRAGEEAADALERMAAENLISNDEKCIIKAEKIAAFWDSDLGKRFAKALKDGRAEREKQFIIGLPVNEINIYADCNVKNKDELVMVQGVIDGYFEENGEIILLDYKTDHVASGEELIRRYKTQMDYYEKAIVAITGKKVRERYLYSFHLGETVSV